jgi:RNA polymerase sigma factor (sigma-70 family)
VSDRGVAPLLETLQSPNLCDSAWADFLDSYSSVLYQTARACTSNEDAAADCYLYICEGLAKNGFRRLLKFKPDGNASFTTWLRVVARNLCMDWHRSQSGRARPFKSLQRLSPLELEVYTCRFIRGASQEETLQRLEPLFPQINFSALSDIEERLQQSLSSRQQWILGSRKQSEFSTSAAAADEAGDADMVDVADSRPNQEAWLVDREQQAQLQKSLASLPTQERLLVQLRFEQDLSLNEIARLCGLEDAQRVNRRLTAILTKLRVTMAVKNPRKIWHRVRAIG